ncbi:Acetoin utilization deacetylase AcuC [Catalinimonas alkaloidigena]|uniref:Acetoin utilization deacetylase AcuC n=1 Tax=Catalinimonas alkaloidigena TaxID=1075417 RepID=A0A1G9HU68_9BACT|nr:histone deacetylase family protein [Catalinimonas alkaloidigena]SDL16500.1 Acetoin utilization deacetylase AcuC [Catalinimonas alkaloidigena]
MFKIRVIQSSSFPASKERLDQVQEIFRQSFPSLTYYADRLPSLLNDPVYHGYNSVLFVAERPLGRLDAFALFLYFPEIKFAFLDFIAVRPGIRGAGLGGALYEAVREYCHRIGAKGLFMEVQPDDPELTPEPQQLKESQQRIRFYEAYGVRPVWNTEYDYPVGDPPTHAYLLYDSLGKEKPLHRADAQQAVRMILTKRFGHVVTTKEVDRIVASFRDDPVQLRPARYRKQSPPAAEVRSHRLDNPYALVHSETHKVHHVPERGYVERPIRVEALLEVLQPLPFFTTLKTKHYGEKPILAVHDRDLVHYLQTVCAKLKEGRPVYPDTFPIRLPERKPKELAVQAGYYCIDSGTPLYKKGYVAAISAVDTALTAADEILAGRRMAYALCRPPGHHAGRKYFGGFCYFNNAAIAAQHLSRHAKVAVLDIDYHHGNGTQDIFYDRADVFTVSIHGHPDYAYPYFTGFEEETGTGAGLGHNLNLTGKPGTGEEAYLKLFQRALDRVLKAGTEILIVGLGYDILKGDPTGLFALKPETLRKMGQLLTSLNLPLLVVQEGGYNILNIRRGSVAFFKGIAEGLAVR